MALRANTCQVCVSYSLSVNEGALCAATTQLSQLLEEELRAEQKIYEDNHGASDTAALDDFTLHTSDAEVKLVKQTGNET